ncbi:CpaF family protein [Pseudooceanicola aestuarii]|uniref:CpaF family protein n=1 Tax=Pseudooceanicola aestuarii TaxID=2697319 RepID=UPI0013D26397|nr:CpaF family protein [Pseudooceanicola aestuarii]
MFDKFRQSRAQLTGQPAPHDAAAPPARAENAGPPPQAAPAGAAPAQAAPSAPAEPPANAGNARRRETLTQVRREVHETLLRTLNLSALQNASEADIRQEIADIVKEIAPSQSIVLSRSDRDEIVDHLYYEVMGFGPLDLLIKDDTISDILINGPEKIYVEKDGVLRKTDIQFTDEAHLRRILSKIVSLVGRRVDEMNPYVDARLPDGSRINAMIAPVAVDGTLVSIRKFRRDSLTLDQLVAFGALSDNMARYLRAAVACRLNIVISGGTGSGKTTLLNALSAHISPRERILTVEDTAELQLQQDHVGRMESRPPNIEGKGEVTQRDCLRNALRMRPDRIIVGETRGDEVIDMLQAMNTGHDGSMTTVHSNSARDAASRLENMVALAGIDIPLPALRRQIASAVNLIVQVSRLQDGTRRLVSITEVTGCEGDIISMQELFAFEHQGVDPDGRVEGQFAPSGVRSHYSDRFRRWGSELPADIYGGPV